MVGAAKSMISKFSNSMVNCKTLSGGVDLGQVDIRRGSGSIKVSGKLPTYPSLKSTLTLTAHLGQNVGLGEG